VKDGRVAGFREKADESGDPQPGWINAGVYVLRADAFDGFQPGTAFSLERDVFPKLVGKTVAYQCACPFDEFADIGTPQSLEAFRTRQMRSGCAGDRSQPQ